MVQINENKKVNPLIYAWTDQTIVYMEPEENKEKGPTENKRLENIKDGLKITSELQKEVIGYGNLGKISNTLTFAEQMHKHGVIKGLWNAFVEVALCRNPQVEAVVTLSKLYDRNLPKDKACSMQWDFKRSTYNQGGQGNWVTQMVEMDLLSEAMECSGADMVLRAPANAEGKILEKVTFK